MAFVLFGDVSFVARNTVLSSVTGWYAQMLHKRHQKRALVQLSALEDHILKDLGLTRGEVTRALRSGGNPSLHSIRYSKSTADLNDAYKR